jgi:hypothetical protein
MLMIKMANLALRFVLELCALAALGYWGWQIGQSTPVKLFVGIGAPLVAAVVWGLFIAPRATMPVPTWLWLLLQLAIFGLAAAGLAVTGHRSLAVALALAVVVNGALLHVWRSA